MKRRGILFFLFSLFFFIPHKKIFAETKATYKINQAVNEKKEPLSSVKVYVDDVYLHHYTPEVLTFCEGCLCDTYTECGFGEHKISLQKTGYAEWFTSITFKEGDFFEVDPVLLVLAPTFTPTPFPSLVPYFSPIPTFLPSPIPTPAPGFYTINSVKDGLGNLLSNVKIYVDGSYVHHYAPEVLKFCLNCKCDEVACNFGTHTFKLEKDGYRDWTETKTINSQDNFEVDPVMNLLPSSAPLPKITTSSTPTIPPNPTITPASTGVILFASFSTNSTVEAQKENISTSEPDILGEFSSESGMVQKESSFSAEPHRSFKYLPFLTIFGGLWLVGAAVYLFLKKEV